MPLIRSINPFVNIEPHSENIISFAKREICDDKKYAAIVLALENLAEIVWSAFYRFLLLLCFSIYLIDCHIVCLFCCSVYYFTLFISFLTYHHSLLSCSIPFSHTVPHFIRFSTPRSSTHPLIHSSTHQLINSSTHQLISSFTHPLIPIHSSTHHPPLNTQHSTLNTQSALFPPHPHPRPPLIAGAVLGTAGVAVEDLGTYSYTVVRWG